MWRIGRDVVGKLVKALYGLRDAPLIWKANLAASLKEIGFCECPVMPGVFRHVERGLMLGVHVDDILVSGDEPNLNWSYERLKKHYEVKRSIVGPGYLSSDVFLGRPIRWTDAGLEWAANTKHVKSLLTDHKMSQCKAMSTPLTMDQISMDERDSGELLNWEDARRFRGSVARINYLAQDRPDLSLAACVLSTRISP